MPLIADLLAKPATLSMAARYTVLNGYLYLAGGGLLLAWPGAAQTVFMERAFVGDEASLIRVIGMALAVIGWFYVFAGRSGARQPIAASVFDRILLVPAVTLPLALMGVFPNILLPFGLIDPAMGLGAWWLLIKDK